MEKGKVVTLREAIVVGQISENLQDFRLSFCEHIFVHIWLAFSQQMIQLISLHVVMQREELLNERFISVELYIELLFDQFHHQVDLLISSQRLKLCPIFFIRREYCWEVVLVVVSSLLRIYCQLWYQLICNSEQYKVSLIQIPPQESISYIVTLDYFYSDCSTIVGILFSYVVNLAEHYMLIKFFSFSYKDFYAEILLHGKFQLDSLFERLLEIYPVQILKQLLFLDFLDFWIFEVFDYVEVVLG